MVGTLSIRNRFSVFLRHPEQFVPTVFQRVGVMLHVRSLRATRTEVEHWGGMYKTILDAERNRAHWAALFSRREFNDSNAVQEMQR